MTKAARREVAILLAGAVLAFVVHAAFRVVGFGEPDEARNARGVLAWHFQASSALNDIGYPLRISPLFLWLMKLFVDHGLSPDSLPAVMNWFGVLMGSVAPVAIYWVFRRLVDAPVAALAVVLCVIAPTIWINSLYGMPTLAAVGFLALSASSFFRALEAPHWKSWRFWRHFGASSALIAIAFGLKADTALAGAMLASLPLVAEPPNLLREKPFSRQPRIFGALLALSVVAIGTVSTLLFAHAVTPIQRVAVPVPQVDAGTFFSDWQKQYPVSFHNLLSPANNACITHAFGTLWFALALIALLRGIIVGGLQRRLACACLLWGLPGLLFWGVRESNSARHCLAAVPPFSLMSALFLFDVAGSKLKAYVLALGLLAVSYLDTTGGYPRTPSVNLVVSTELLRDGAAEVDDTIRNFLAGPAKHKVFIELENPSAIEFAIWAKTQWPPASLDLQDPRGGDDSIYLVTVGNRDAAVTTAADLRLHGFATCSVGIGFCDFPGGVRATGR